MVTFFSDSLRVNLNETAHHCSEDIDTDAYLWPRHGVPCSWGHGLGGLRDHNGGPGVGCWLGHGGFYPAAEGRVKRVSHDERMRCFGEWPSSSPLTKLTTHREKSAHCCSERSHVKDMPTSWFRHMSWHSLCCCSRYSLHRAALSNVSF